MQEKIRIAVIDDHPIFRDGVVYTLKASKVFEVVGEGGNISDAVRIAEEKQPAVMLLDISMPGGGIVAAGEISARFKAIKLIMLTVSEQEEDVTASLKAGAMGFVVKGSSGPELMQVIQSVHAGESYVSPGLAARLLTQMQAARNEAPAEKSPLTAREVEILEQVRQGLTNKEIARNLTVSEKTIKHYMTSIMHKLNVRNRVEAVIHFRRTNGKN